MSEHADPVPSWKGKWSFESRELEDALDLLHSDRESLARMCEDMLPPDLASATPPWCESQREISRVSVDQYLVDLSQVLTDNDDKMKEILNIASLESSRHDMDELQKLAAGVREIHDNATAALKVLKMEDSCHRTVAKELTDELGTTRQAGKQLTAAWGVLDLLNRPALMRQSKNGRNTRQAVRTLHDKVLSVDDVPNPHIDEELRQRIADIVNLDEKKMGDAEEDLDAPTAGQKQWKRRTLTKASEEPAKKKKKAQPACDVAAAPLPKKAKMTPTPASTDASSSQAKAAAAASIDTSLAEGEKIGDVD